MNPITPTLVLHVSNLTQSRSSEDQVLITNTQLFKLIEQELPQLNEYEIDAVQALLIEVVKPLFEQERIKGIRHITTEEHVKYQARIALPNGSTPSLGTYTTVVEANAAMKAAAKVLELVSSKTQSSLDDLSQDDADLKPSLVDRDYDDTARICTTTGKVLFRGGTYNSFAEAYNTP